MRPTALLIFCLAASAGAWAQAPSGAPAPLVGDNPDQGRNNQRVERLRFEDKGTRIDELRYGGESQSITVQPLNSALPSYEVLPYNGARVRPGNERDAASGNAGQRVWNVLGF